MKNLSLPYGLSHTSVVWNQLARFLNDGHFKHTLGSSRVKTKSSRIIFIETDCYIKLAHKNKTTAKISPLILMVLYDVEAWK